MLDLRSVRHATEDLLITIAFKQTWAKIDKFSMKIELRDRASDPVYIDAVAHLRVSHQLQLICGRLSRRLRYRARAKGANEMAFNF